MSTVATDVCIDTKGRAIFYRGFIIQEAYNVLTKTNVWEWAEEDWTETITGGDCQTLFECIDAVDAWHEERVEA